jgi:hypothetical protein
MSGRYENLTEKNPPNFPRNNWKVGFVANDIEYCLYNWHNILFLHIKGFVFSPLTLANKVQKVVRNLEFYTDRYKYCFMNKK